MKFWSPEDGRHFFCSVRFTPFSVFQVQNESGERGWAEPTQSALSCHPNAPGTPRRCTGECDGAHGQRDQLVGPLGGKLTATELCRKGMTFELHVFPPGAPNFAVSVFVHFLLPNVKVVLEVPTVTRLQAGRCEPKLPLSGCVPG